MGGLKLEKPLSYVPAFNIDTKILLGPGAMCREYMPKLFR